MFSKFLNLFSKKDDLERVMAKGDLTQLSDYLEHRTLLFPKKPLRFLDGATLNQEDMLELIEEEANSLNDDNIELWIMDMDGKALLPAFSSHKNMEVFSSRLANELDKAFSLGCVEILLADLPSQLKIDVIDINRFSPNNYELGIK